MRLSNAIVVLALLGGTVLPVAAQERSPARDVQERDIRRDVRREAQEMREAQRNAIEERREELRREIDTRRREAEENVRMIREEARERIEAQRAQLRERLEMVRDERKRAVALRVDAELNRLNERWTNHFLDILDRFADVLGRVEVRMEKARELGKDVSNVPAAIQAARTAIAAARGAVEEQAGKSYAATFDSEEELGQGMRNARGMLHDDLTALRDGPVRSAREAVQGAIRALSNIQNVDEEPDNEEEEEEEEQEQGNEE